MTIFLRLLSRTPRFGCIACLVALLFATQQLSLAESTFPPIDERCEIEKLLLEFDRSVAGPCEDRARTCTDERTSQFNETQDQARKFCWRRPLNVDPRFLGPCPSNLENFETAVYEGKESILTLIRLRLSFDRLDDRGFTTYESFKENESLQSIHQYLAKEPDNPVALSLLSWLLLGENNPVERMKLEIKMHDLDPDCPETRWMRHTTTFNLMNTLADNWLAESGPGSELSVRERRELLQDTRSMLLDMYDIAVEQDIGTNRLFWALESIYDAVLSGMFENLQQVAHDLEIDLEDYASKRRETLVRYFSHEYDVDSEHSPAQTLATMCNDLAFELGLTDHCFKLLEHYEHNSTTPFYRFRTEWAQAAILLVNAVTRDCSGPDPLFVCAAPIWWSDRQCVAEGRDSFARRIHDLLPHLPLDDTSAETELLKAYLSLDGTSDEHFLRAFALDASIVHFAARLSKRLLKHGEVEAASNILASIHAEQTTHLHETEKNLLKKTNESAREGSYFNWTEYHLDSYQYAADQ